jgi:hypothetical protein
MQHFMSKQKLNFFGTQHLNEASVVVKITSVCCGSSTPLISIDQFQTCCKVAKETGFQQQTHTG